jgi:hypothetical protein
MNFFRRTPAAVPTGKGTAQVAGKSGSDAPSPADEDEAEDEDETAEDEDLDEAEGGDEDETEATDEDEPGDEDDEEVIPAKKGAKGKAATGDGARIQAILTSPEGRANPGLAEAFAFSSKLSATKAIEFLKASKPAAATGKRQSLGAALAAEGADRPRVGMGGSKAEAKSAEDEQIASIVKAAAGAGMTRKSA